MPIDPGYIANLKNKGFPYPVESFETLNYKEYLCKSCGANDRDRLIALYLQTRSHSNNMKILDFAASPSLQSVLKSIDGSSYRSADLYMDGVDDKVDITNMKLYNENSFDLFVCSHLLEHVDDIKALKELYRITKRGGRGIILTPIIDNDDVFDEDMSVTDADERCRRFAQDDHVRLYSKTVLLERLSESGFKVEQLRVWNFGIWNFIRYGIKLRSVLYVVEK